MKKMFFALMTMLTVSISVNATMCSEPIGSVVTSI